MMQCGDARGFRAPDVAFKQEVGYEKFMHS